jgi:ferric-dicitrate binding protein FerR (iron transport regulator)
VDERHWQMVVRVFSGEATPAERAEVERWAAADAANAAELDALRAVWEATGRLPARGDADRAWARLAARTVAAHDPQVVSLAARRRAAAVPAWRTAALRIAAALVVALGAAALWGPVSGAVHDHVLNHTVTTGRGERLALRLPDGTRVSLGVQSRLSWPRRFGAARRDVRLQGAAYFEVAHDAARPFTVYSADAVTRVLGTKFSVRDYPAEPARIAVTEGRVAVSPSTDPSPQHAAAILVKGDAAQVDARGGTDVIHRADEGRELAWTRGSIAFQNAPVRDVAAEVSRWYDVDVRVTDPELAARHLTITFDHEPLETVLRDMAAALNAHVERHGLTVILAPAPADPRGGAHPAGPTYSL